MDHNASPTPAFHQKNDDSPEAMAERIRALYGIEPTNIDELHRLTADKEAGERLEVFLDDLTYEALSTNEDFNRNRKDMMSGKLSAEQQAKVRDEQRALFNRYRQGIIEEAGLPTDTGMTEVEKSRQAIKSKLEQSLAGHDTSEPLKVLEALGIITHDKEGKEIFTYPEGLFPKSTDNKWEVYLESVRNHLRIERAVHSGTVDKRELGDADTIRRAAHNAVSREVHEVLGLESLEGSDWDFDKTRNLLAKMRDSRWPTVETREKAVTEEAVLEGVIGLQALRTLRSNLADLHHGQNREEM